MNTFVTVVLFVVGAVCLMLVGARLSRKPLVNGLLFDRGHRCYGVTAKARPVVLRVLNDNGLGAWQQFDSGPTNQTIMDDGFTVINVVEPSFLGPQTSTGRKGTSLSLPVQDPVASAAKAVKDYREAGFFASSEAIDDPSLKGKKIVIVSSAAHPEWELTLRPPIRNLPKPDFRKP